MSRARGKRLRLLGTILAGAALVVVALAIVAIAALTVAGGPIVAAVASAMLGRDVSIGAMSIAWGGQTAVTLHDVAVANAPWGSRPDMLRAERVEFEISLPSLLRLDPRVPRIAAAAPDLLLEVDAQGRRNWAFVTDRTAAPDGPPDLYGLDAFAASAARIAYRDARFDAVRTVALADLEARAPGPASPVTIAGRGTIEPDGGAEPKPVQLAAELGSLDRLRAPAEPYPVAIAVEIGAARATLDGHVVDPLRMSGASLRLAAESTDLASLLRLAGLGVASTPRFEIAARIESDDGAAWTADALAASLGDSRVEGVALLDLSEPRPYLGAELTATRLAAEDLPVGAAAETSAGAAPNWDDPLPFGALTALDGDLSLEIREIAVPELPIASGTIELSLDQGVLRVSPLRLETADGVVAASLAVDASQAPPTMHFAAEMQNLAIGSLGVDAAGHVDGRADLRSAGDTLAALIDRLAGAAAVQFGGRVRGMPATLQARLGADDARPLRLEGEIGGAHLRIDGTLGRSLSADAMRLGIEARGDSVAPVLALAGLEPTDAAPPFRLAARLSRGADAWRLDDVSAELGASAVTGTAALDLSGPRPYLRADIAAPRVAVDELRQIAGTSGAGANATDDDDAIKRALALLRAADADLALHAAAITAAAFRIDEARMDLALADGVLRLAPMRLRLPDGGIIAELRADASQDPPALEFATTIQRLSIAPVAALAGIETPVKGILAGRAELRMAGSSLDALAATLAGSASLTLDGQAADMPVTAWASLGAAPSGDASQGAALPVTFDASVADARIRISGVLRRPQAPGDLVDARLDASGPALLPLLRLAGISPPPAPVPFALTGRLTGGPRAWRLDGVRAELKQTAIHGAATLDLSESRPQAEAELVAPRLSVAELRLLVPQTPDSSADGVIPDASVPFALLRQFDGVASLRVERVVEAPLPTEGVLIVLRLNDGDLRLDPIRIALADGTVAVEGGVDAARQPPHVHAAANLHQLRLDELAPAFGIGPPLSGRLSGRLDLAAAGETVQALAGDLSGQAALWVPEGQIGTQLVDALALSLTRVFSLLFSSAPQTLECFVGAFDLERGVARPTTLVFATEDTVIRGDGTIDFGAERLDLSFMPRPRGTTLLGVQVPVDLTGSFADPDVSVGVSLGAPSAQAQPCARAAQEIEAAPAHVGRN